MTYDLWSFRWEFLLAHLSCGYPLSNKFSQLSLLGNFSDPLRKLRNQSPRGRVLQIQCQGAQQDYLWQILIKEMRFHKFQVFMVTQVSNFDGQWCQQSGMCVWIVYKFNCFSLLCVQAVQRSYVKQWQVFLAKRGLMGLFLAFGSLHPDPLQPLPPTSVASLLNG